MKLYFADADDTHRAFVVGSTGTTNSITRQDRKTFLRYSIPDVANQLADDPKGIRYSANVLYGLLKIHTLQVTQLLDDTVHQMRHLKFNTHGKGHPALALIDVKLGKPSQPYREVSKGQFFDNSSICLPRLRFISLQELPFLEDSQLVTNSETSQVTLTETAYDETHNEITENSVQLDFDFDAPDPIEFDIIDPAPPLEEAQVSKNVGDITTDPHFQASTQLTLRHSRSRLFDERSVKRQRVMVDAETQLDLSLFWSTQVQRGLLKTVSARLQELAHVWTHSTFNPARMAKCVNHAATTAASDTVAHFARVEETETGMGDDDDTPGYDGVDINDDIAGGWDYDDGYDDDNAAGGIGGTAPEVTASLSMDAMVPGVNKPFREYMHAELVHGERSFLDIFPPGEITKQIAAVSFFAGLALASNGTITMRQPQGIRDPFGTITLGLP